MSQSSSTETTLVSVYSMADMLLKSIGSFASSPVSSGLPPKTLNPFSPISGSPGIAELRIITYNSYPPEVAESSVRIKVN